MSAYMVVHVNVKDADKVQEYSGAAAPLVAAHGGRFISRGPVEVMSGEHAYQMLVIIEFPDNAAAKAFYASPEYQALLPVREAGLDSVFLLGSDQP
jgi:uncharacterized protein (DUF1330 family)